MSPQENRKSPGLAAAIADSRSLLLRQANRMLRNGDGAEDAVQDAMLAALRNLGTYRGDARLGTWMYRVGANAVLMGMRRQRRAADRTIRAARMLPLDSSWLHGSFQASGPQSRLERAEQTRILRRAIGQLPEHYRCVVHLCDFDDRPIEDVAATLGLTVGGVRTRRLRAHRMLLDTLEGRSEEFR